MEELFRIKQLFERVSNPYLNNGKPLNEAEEASFKTYWDQEKESTKKEMWDMIVKVRESNPNLYKEITPKHVDFIVETFGTKFGPNVDPNLARNILKNPERFLGKLNDYFSNQPNNPKPNGLKNFAKEVAQESNNLVSPNVILQMFGDEKTVRQAYYDHFKKFTDKRHEWRKKIDKVNLTGKTVSYYISNSAPTNIKFTGIGKGVVLIDFAYMDQKQEKLFEKLVGKMPEMVQNKNVGIAEADEQPPTDQGQNEQGSQDVFDINKLKTDLNGYVVLRSSSSGYNMLMSKNNVLPSNVVLNPKPPVPTPPGPTPPVPTPPGPTPPVPTPPGPTPPGPTPPGPTDDIVTYIENDNNINHWFSSPVFQFKDGQLFSINPTGGTKSLIDKLFKTVTKLDYFHDKVKNRLEKRGFDVELEKDEEYSTDPATTDSENILIFLKNCVDSPKKLVKTIGDDFYLKVVNYIAYKMEGDKITLVTLYKSGFNRKFGPDSNNVIQDLLKNIDESALNYRGNIIEIS